MSVAFRIFNFTGEVRQFSLVVGSPGNISYQTTPITVPEPLTTAGYYLYRDNNITSTDGLYLVVDCYNSPQPSSWSGAAPITFPLSGRQRTASSGTQVVIALYADPAKIYFTNNGGDPPQYGEQTLDRGVGTDTAYYVYRGVRTPYQSGNDPSSGLLQSGDLAVALTPVKVVWGNTTVASTINDYPCPPITDPGYVWKSPAGANPPGFYYGTRVYS